MTRITKTLLAVTTALLVCATPALAGKNVRSSSRTSVNTNKNVGGNTNVNRNTNINHNTNVNVHKDVDIDVDVHHGYGHGCCYDNHYHPVAAAVVTAAVIGSIIYSLPPACTVVYVNGFAYQQCGSTWYQPQFVGTSTTYVVIAPPR